MLHDSVCDCDTERVAVPVLLTSALNTLELDCDREGLRESVTDTVDVF